MEESRKQFEEWFSDKGKYPKATEKLKGEYLLASARAAWDGWQASRAAIEIKLDDKVMVEDEFDKGHNGAIEYCAEAIRSVGLKVKS